MFCSNDARCAWHLAILQIAHSANAAGTVCVSSVMIFREAERPEAMGCCFLGLLIDLCCDVLPFHESLLLYFLVGTTSGQLLVT